jgi:hypothetical protein
MTNTTETTDEPTTYRQEVERMLVSLPESQLNAGTVLINALWDFDQNSKQIEQAAYDLKRDIDQMMSDLENGYVLNSSGVIQGRGPKLDALLASRSEIVHRIKSLAYVLKGFGVDVNVTQLLVPQA